MAYCLAIDIGASSGRHILGEVIDGQIRTTEVYRFDNGFKQTDGTLCWDIEELTENVLAGIAKCHEIGKIPATVAIDTWGVDYVLMDADRRVIPPVVAYRDSRTVGVPDQVDRLIPQAELYRRTGIQRQNYNTIYQLFCDVQTGKLDKASYLLMVPEYLTYRLTGEMKSEYTIASTSALLNAETRDWDRELMEKLGINPAVFQTICEPGSEVGHFTDEVKARVGFDATVLFAPAHDTASAVAACTLVGHGMYISSGTWSLIGAENRYPVVNEQALAANFTNEGGVNHTYRFLKNIMGMWLFQNIRKNLNKKYTYDEMMYMAMESSYKKTFNPNDERLVAPENMITAIRECLGEPDLPLGDTINSVYCSLATSYAQVVKEVEAITGEAVDCINIVGGGSKDTYLNRLTEEYTGKKTLAGPVEATALGNLKTQLRAISEI